MNACASLASLLLAAVVVACAAVAQTPEPPIGVPAVERPAEVAAASLTRLRIHEDGSIGGRLQDAGGGELFHVGVSATSCELALGSSHGGGRARRVLARGSKLEKAFVARLLRWSRSAFSAEELAVLVAAEDVTQAAGMNAQRFLESLVVNRLAHFQRLCGAKIRQVFPGRSTVALSMKIRDGLGHDLQVLFRRLDEGVLRPHLGDATECIRPDSLRERIILAAMQNFVDASLAANTQDLLWSGAKIKPGEGQRDAMRMLATLIEYRSSSCPRILSVHFYLDGGSTLFQLVDARGRKLAVRFDKEIGSDKHGRMFWMPEGGDEVLVAFGGEREKYLLDGFDAHLRRGGDDQGDVLKNLLARYRDLQKAAKK